MQIKFLILAIFVQLTFITFGEEYIASLKDPSAWSREEIVISQDLVVFSNIAKPGIIVTVIGANDVTIDFETSPAAVYLKSSGAVLDEKKKLSSLKIGDDTYDDVSYWRYIARMNNRPVYSCVWQLQNNQYSYTISILFPCDELSYVNKFLNENLILLPVERDNENKMIKMANQLCISLQKFGPQMMGEGVLMVGCNVDSEKKILSRTYRFTHDASEEDIETSRREVSQQMIEFEKDTVPLVRLALKFGYQLEVIWENPNGTILAKHLF